MESIKMLCYDFPDKAYITLHGLAAEGCKIEADLYVCADIVDEIR